MTKNCFSKTSSTATLPVALRLLAGTAMVISLQSCAVVAVADAAVTETLAFHNIVSHTPLGWQPFPQLLQAIVNPG